VEFCYQFEKIFFIFSISGETSRFVTGTVAAINLPPKGRTQRHNALLSFWQETSLKNGHHIFWALNAENVFFYLQQKSSPLKGLSHETDFKNVDKK
jgi:hypothetical protein